MGELGPLDPAKRSWVGPARAVGVGSVRKIASCGKNKYDEYEPYIRDPIVGIKRTVEQATRFR